MSKTTNIAATLATVAALSIGALAAPQTAQAHGVRYHHSGFFGGLAAGALIGSAFGYAPYYYGYAPYYDGFSRYGYSSYYGHSSYYYGSPYYYGARSAYYYGSGYGYYGAGYYGSDCFWTRKRVYYGHAWHWRRVRVC